MAVAPGELGSEHIVQIMENDIQLRAERFADLVGRRPALSILSANLSDQPSATYMGIKKRVGERLGIDVSTTVLDDARQLRQRILLDNDWPKLDGIIVQLPLQEEDHRKTSTILGMIEPTKDVDGLAPYSIHRPATVEATLKWLNYHGVDFMEEPVALVGLGRLVGSPLLAYLRGKQAPAEGFDKTSEPLEVISCLDKAGIIVSATGHPGLLTPDLFLTGTKPKVLVDVGTAEQNGAQQGDVSDELRGYALEHGWTLTPKHGGIGPLTVRALLTNLMDSAESRTGILQPINEYRLNLTLAGTSRNCPADQYREEDDRDYAPTEIS